MHVTRKTARYANQPIFCDLGAPASMHGRTAAEGRRKSAAPRPPRSKRTLVLGEVELKRIEDALLDALLDHHVNRDNALDRLLDDMNEVEARRRSEPLERDDRRQAKKDFEGPGKVARIEELLVAAVLDSHPNRNRALERLLNDIEVVNEEIARYDMQVDNDFDGLA